MMKSPLLLLLFLASPLAAQPIPQDVFELRSGIYAFSDNVGFPDDEGITVEAWVYFKHAPPDTLHERVPDGCWAVFGKPGSYLVYIDNRHAVNFVIERESGQAGWEANVRGHGFPADSYRNWVHIAFYMAPTDVEEEVTSHLFFNRRWVGGDGGPFSRPRMGRTNSPFVVGGPHPEWGRGYWPLATSMEGYIDELRISKRLVYPTDGGQPFAVERPFLKHARTIALWHFEEGMDAGAYADSSGNGHTLHVDSSRVGVEQQDKLSILWGDVKN